MSAILSMCFRPKIALRWDWQKLNPSVKINLCTYISNFCLEMTRNDVSRFYLFSRNSILLNFQSLVQKKTVLICVETHNQVLLVSYQKDRDLNLHCFQSMKLQATGYEVELFNSHKFTAWKKGGEGHPYRCQLSPSTKTVLT